MPEPPTEPGTERYWENLAADGSGEDEEGRALVDVVRDRTATDRTVRGVIHADTGEDGTMYLLVIYTRIADAGHLVLGERYFFVDPENPEDGSYGSQGIERRVSGNLPAALVVAYGAVRDGAGQGEDPVFTVRVDEDTIDQRPASLEAPIHADGDEVAASIAKHGEGHRLESATCRKCGEDAAIEDLVDVGADLGNVWVHRGSCPTEDEEGDT